DWTLRTMSQTTKAIPTSTKIIIIVPHSHHQPLPPIMSSWSKRCATTVESTFISDPFSYGATSSERGGPRRGTSAGPEAAAAELEGRRQVSRTFRQRPEACDLAGL